MPLYRFEPVANGLRTEHPVPDLPFVDDSHLPLDDPQAIEAIGRRHEEGYDGWGRTDRIPAHRGAGWVAATTDQTRQDLAWIVRYHPEHGRSVLVVRNKEMPYLHQLMTNEAPEAVLFRFGGYFWDGATWHRPGQVWNWADEQYFRRAVPAAVTVTAGDLLQNGGDPTKARILPISEVDPAAPPARNWLDDLALWAARRDDKGLGDSVVALAAPELTADAMIGVPEMADLAGIAASTLRAYIARNENDVPLPQATIGRRDLWARPVAAEWVEARSRSHESVAQAVTASEGSQPVGIADLWDRFHKTFLSDLWERPDWRKRWAMRWRTPDAVDEIAKTLSWEVAASLDHIVPITDIAQNLERSVLDQIHESLERSKFLNKQPIDWDETHDEDDAGAQATGSRLTRADWDSFGLDLATERLIDWLVRHDPATASHTLPAIVGAAKDRYGVPHQVTERTLAHALAAGELDRTHRKDFLSRIFTPTDTPG